MISLFETNSIHLKSKRNDIIECSWILEKDGAAEGTRTPDPIITNDVLYQLSYTGPVARC